MLPRKLARALGACVLSLPSRPGCDRRGPRRDPRPDPADERELRSSDTRARRSSEGRRSRRRPLLLAQLLPPYLRVGPHAAAASTYAASTLAAFNPGIAVVLQGNYQYLTQDPALYGFNSIQIGEDVTPGAAASASAKSEITFFANVDHLFAGSLTVSLAPDNSVESRKRTAS